jgi:hypothetical protein
VVEGERVDPSLVDPDWPRVHLFPYRHSNDVDSREVSWVPHDQYVYALLS